MDKENKKINSIKRIKSSGKNHYNWKGGVRYPRGYVAIHNREHPNNIGGYVMEHRLVMEKKLGRYLTSDELVHHINGNRKDNRIENLELTDNKNHKKSYGDAYTQGYNDGLIKRYFVKHPYKKNKWMEFNTLPEAREFMEDVVE